MMGEQRKPKQFPLSLAVSQVIMTVCYLFVSLLAYTYGGQNGESCKQTIDTLKPSLH